MDIKLADVGDQEGYNSMIEPHHANFKVHPDDLPNLLTDFLLLLLT